MALLRAAAGRLLPSHACSSPAYLACQQLQSLASFASVPAEDVSQRELVPSTRELLDRKLTLSETVSGFAEHRTAFFDAWPVVHGPDGRPLPRPPTLVSTPERTWGPQGVLPAALYTGPPAERIAVVRHPFLPDTGIRWGAPDLGLSADTRHRVVAAYSTEGRVENAVLVDDYDRTPSGDYALRRAGTDLHRWLHESGVRAAHVAHRLALKENGTAALAAGVSQSTNEVLMVAPTAFGFNAQAAQDNAFMHARTHGEAPLPGGEPSGMPAGTEATEGQPSVTAQALREFAGLHHELTQVAGVRVHLCQHALAHNTPDACFPNNWLTTHPRGEAAGGVAQRTLVLYPMKCPNRAAERRPDIISSLGFRGYERTLDLSAAEREGRAFEGTGVLVLDRINGVAYIGLSERADRGLAEHWVDALGYKEAVFFTATDAEGRPVYHTNVVMAVGTDVAVVCSEAVEDARERQHLLARLNMHHHVVEISRAQMGAMCGNILELQNGVGMPVLAMSSAAHAAFTPEQRGAMRRHAAALHHAPIHTIEHIGGGSVRCCIAELF